MIKLEPYSNKKIVNVSIKATQIIKVIQAHASKLCCIIGVPSSCFTTCSLCAGGAMYMALLMGKCDTNVIKWMAWWHSNAMM